MGWDFNKNSKLVVLWILLAIILGNHNFYRKPQSESNLKDTSKSWMNRILLIHYIFLWILLIELLGKQDSM